MVHVIHSIAVTNNHTQDTFSLVTMVEALFDVATPRGQGRRGSRAHNLGRRLAGGGTVGTGALGWDLSGLRAVWIPLSMPGANKHFY